MRHAFPAALAAIAISLAGAGQVAATPASAHVLNVCGRGVNSTELVNHIGEASCPTVLRVMRAWRRAGNPKAFRAFTCGEVPGVKVAFYDEKRWFATWQCSLDTRIYRIWTRY
jgi:hypothetical protein